MNALREMFYIFYTFDVLSVFSTFLHFEIYLHNNEFSKILFLSCSTKRLILYYYLKTR